MTDELLKTYDNEGNVVEPKLRSFIRAQAEPKQFFASITAIWVVNRKGQVLCSRRAETVINYPGLWQTYFGGHVQADSDYLPTAVRELYEEAGIIAAPHELYEIVRRRTRHGTYACGYAFLFDEARHSVAFVDGEVSEVRWISLEEYNAELLQRPDDWCNTISLEEQTLVRDWLEKKTTA